MSSKPNNKRRLKAIKVWWRKMQPDRASLARIRRCKNIIDVLNERPVVGLLRCCKAESYEDIMRIGLTLYILSHVRNNHIEDDYVRDKRGRVSTARMIGPKDRDDESTALCKSVRFRRLLATKDVEECRVAFRRLVALMRGKASVADLAETLMEWPFFPGQEERSKWRRVRWVHDYWNIGMSEK